MKDAIDMAREAGFVEDVEECVATSVWVQDTEITEQIERLVELARADQDEKYKWDIHSCGPTCKRYACVAIREAVEAEREAINQEWSMCVQSDLEHGVKSLSENAAAKWNKEYPEIAKFGAWLAARGQA